MQHITPDWKGWDYSDIPGGGHKDLQEKLAPTLEKPPTATHPNIDQLAKWPIKCIFNEKKPP